MIIATFNVNSIRSRIEILLHWLDAHYPTPSRLLEARSVTSEEGLFLHLELTLELRAGIKGPIPDFAPEGVDTLKSYTIDDDVEYSVLDGPLGVRLIGL